MKKFYALLCLTITCLSSTAQIGNLDPTFGVNGTERIKYIPKGELVSKKGETFTIEVTPGFNAGIRVIKYLSNGNIDITYGNFGFTVPVDMKYAMSAIQEDGKIVVAGTVAFPLYIHDQTKVARFNTDGSIDYTFTTPDRGTVYNFPAKITKSKNDVYLLGYAASASAGMNFDWVYSNQSLSYVSSVRSNSGLSYAGLNVADFAKSKTVAVEGNKMIVAGLELNESPTFPYQSSYGYYLSKYTNRLSDPSFGSNGRVKAALSPDSYEHMLLTPDGKLIIASTVLNTNTGKHDFRVTRLNENGFADQTFNGSGTQTTEFGADLVVNSVVLNGDKIIVGGTAKNELSGATSFALARYDSNGSPDKTFSEDGKQMVGEEGYSYKLEDMQIQENRLLVFGTIVSNGGEAFKAVAAILLSDNIILTCQPTTIVSTTDGLCSAVVTGINPLIISSNSNVQVNYTITGATTGTGSGSVSGKTFNKGESIVTYTVVNDPLKSCSFKVLVEDKEAPLITNLSVDPKTVHFANHKMVDISVNYTLSDNCGVVSPSIIVSSNEPESGIDKDDIENDWKVVDEHHVQLRAERSSKGFGRVYTIKVVAKDLAGNSSEQDAKVYISRNSPIVKVQIPPLNVKVLTNPSTDLFTILLSSNSTEKLSLRVVDILGRVVETRSGILPKGILQIGAEYKKGIYFGEIIQQDQIEKFKIIKN
ncbi:MAG: T9SS type A sorting domain-containing protein [Bacteroidota bacterium]|nr:T9SS type A sorting domain-containing protein [Bacteroidota bacterium]